MDYKRKHIPNQILWIEFRFCSNFVSQFSDYINTYFDNQIGIICMNLLIVITLIVLYRMIVFYTIEIHESFYR